MNRKIVLDEKEIQEICKRLGKEISDKLRNENKIPVIVGVLKGSLNFMMDLMKYIDVRIYTDYIQVSSYCGSKSSGHVQLIKDLSFNCEGRTVIIVEDIVDTGNSMDYLLEHIKSHKVKDVFVCALFDKKAFRVKDVKVDFIGRELEGDDFLIGYGLDYNELDRNVPYVYAANKENLKELDDLIENKK